MGSDQHVIEIVTVLRTLTAHLVLSDSLPAAVETLAQTAANLVDCSCSSVITVTEPPGRLSTVAVVCSDHAHRPRRRRRPDTAEPERWTQVQYDTGCGPCISALGHQEMTVSQDLTRDSRWPGWTAWVVERGVRGVLSAPIDVDERLLGALTLYLGQPERCGPDLELAIMFLAEQAGLLLAALSPLAAGQSERPERPERPERCERLDRAPAPSPREAFDAMVEMNKLWDGDAQTIHQAVGIVVAQRHCSADDALAILAQASAILRLPMESIAERLIDTVAREGLPLRKAHSLWHPSGHPVVPRARSNMTDPEFPPHAN